MWYRIHSKETLIKFIKDSYEINKKSSYGSLKNYPNFPKVTYFKTQFGTWNKALKDAGIKIYKKTEEKKQYSCTNCNKIFLRHESQLKQSINCFCSRSCAATYNNTHKKHGTRRSKLENYLEEKLTAIFPDLEFHFNKKDAINSELDIYIPSLKIAFELNGIYHYEPIHGIEKLSQTQNNDQRKFQACLEKNIELCIIDSSKMKNFKVNTAKIYLDIILNIIKMKI